MILSYTELKKRLFEDEEHKVKSLNEHLLIEERLLEAIQLRARVL